MTSFGYPSSYRNKLALYLIQASSPRITKPISLSLNKHCWFSHCCAVRGLCVVGPRKNPLRFGMGMHEEEGAILEGRIEK